MISSLILIIISIALAIIEWKTTNLSKYKWKTTIKILFALIIAGIGILNIFDGYISRVKGFNQYRKRDYVGAIHNFSIVEKSPFSNRKVLDYMALSYKKIGDQAIDAPVAEQYYRKSLNYSMKSRVQYPHSPFSKNNMINIYRKLKEWKLLDPIVKSFNRELAIKDYYKENGAPLLKSSKANFYVTLGNVFADRNYPKQSMKNAVKYYEYALKIDPKNIYVILNLPTRLLDLVDISKKRSVKIKILQRAYTLSVAGVTCSNDENKIFAFVNLIQTLCNPLSSQIKHKKYKLRVSLKAIELLIKNVRLIDVETWFVLAEAYIKIGNKSRASFYMNRALVEEHKFTKSQNLWMKEIKKKINIML
ncbi:MAG: hypothetical protein KAT05_05820 [Spirochaetes bacterium]|nr:hypothetical protein [Spirochaetota bacterium]